MWLKRIANELDDNPGLKLLLFPPGAVVAVVWIISSIVGRPICDRVSDVRRRRKERRERGRRLSYSNDGTAGFVSKT